MIASMAVEICPERPEEFVQVRALNARAFGRDDEGRLVDAVRRREESLISLVAVEGDRVVGHIFFSPVAIASDERAHRAVGLGPMSVHPDLQRQGVGGKLIRCGLEACREAGYGVMVVLGHPAYYPRFGFVRADTHGIRWEKEVPGDAFMVRELTPGALEGCAGVARYLPEFMTMD
jgi:putative acetyltransferase